MLVRYEKRTKVGERVERNYETGEGRFGCWAVVDELAFDSFVIC